MQSRTAKSIKNVKVATLFYVVNLILTFISRKVFIDHLGAEVLGLNTTAVNLLGFLNLAEFGIGGAIAYTLYKPLYEHDTDKINDILTVQGYLYRKAAYIVAALSFILLFFFPVIFAKAQVEFWYPYATFIVLLFGSLLSYLVNYKQIILSADQKGYKSMYVNKGMKGLKDMLQIIAMVVFSHGYVYWLVLEFLMSVCTAVYLNRIIHKEYPWLNVMINKGRQLQKEYPHILIKTKQLFFHKLSGFVSLQTIPLIIYSYTSLTIVAIYGNYQLIILGISSLLSVVFNSLGAGVGNLVAEGKKERILSVFWELYSSRFWITSIMCFSFYVLSTPFIKLWVGEEYVIGSTPLILMILIAFCQITKVTLDHYISAYGLYQDIWVPIVNVPLYIGISLLFGYYWGLSGILSGALISAIFIALWKPFFLYTKGFKRAPTEYFLTYVKYIAIALICCWGVMRIAACIEFEPEDSYWDFILYGLIVVGLYITVYTILFFFMSNGMRCFVARITSVMFKKNHL